MQNDRTEEEYTIEKKFGNWTYAKNKKKVYWW